MLQNNDYDSPTPSVLSRQLFVFRGRTKYKLRLTFELYKKKFLLIGEVTYHVPNLDLFEWDRDF